MRSSHARATGASFSSLTGGNPFFATEIVQTGSGEIPSSARDAVLAPLARLSDGARRAVDTAALIGSHVEPVLLGAVAGSTPENLDELVCAGALVSDGATLRFRHEITRLAVEGEYRRTGTPHPRTSPRDAVRQVGVALPSQPPHTSALTPFRAVANQFSVAGADSRYAAITDHAEISCIADPAGSGAMGIHYLDPDILFDGAIAAARPEAIVYAPSPSGALHSGGEPRAAFWCRSTPRPAID